MKWGIRRYQNVDGSLTPEGKIHYGASSETREYAKRLNREDVARAKAVREVNDSTTAKNAYHKRIKKITSKYADPVNGKAKKPSDRVLKRIEKYSQKEKEAAKKAAEYEKVVKKHKREIDRLIREAQSSGLTVQSKEVNRDVTKGYEIATSLLASTASISIASLAGLPIAPIGMVNVSVKGNKYRVGK
jgi:cell division septum initiation protein DivIVA